MASSVQMGDTFYLVGGQFADERSATLTWLTQKVYRFDNHNFEWEEVDRASWLYTFKALVTAFAVDSRLFPLKCPNEG